MIKFLLVLDNFNTFLVNTPFVEEWQFTQWLNGVQTINPSGFAQDPLANLPPKSFANQILNEDEIQDLLDVGLIVGSDVIPTNDPMLKACHGTLMVDDNDSIFYSANNQKAEWKLPYLLHRN
jgi:hypothetical protein